MHNHKLLVSEGIQVTSAYNYDVIIYTAIGYIVYTAIDSFNFFCQINQEMSHKSLK